MSVPQPRHRKRSGFTLLEVILAFTILGISIAVLGELVRIGSRNALLAREVTQAQLLCETKMNEVVAGIEPAQPVLNRPYELVTSVRRTEWLYSIDVQTLVEEGLLAVTVTVTKDLPNDVNPPTFSLVRWMQDPATATDETSTDSTSDSPSRGTTTSCTDRAWGKGYV